MGWFYQREGNRWAIRSVVKVNGKKKQPRYPYKKYKHLESEEQIRALVDLINHNQNKRKNIEVRNAFVPVEKLEEFRERLLVEIPSTKDARYLYKCLHRHTLQFFTKLELNPSLWINFEAHWGSHLLGLGLAPKSLKHIILVSNRFFDFMKLPKLKPLTKARLKEQVAVHALSKPSYKGSFMSEEHFALLRNEAIYLLMYSYGLRRAEALALQCSDVRQGYLSVERQHGNRPLKGRRKRKTPHWFASAEQAYAWISSLVPVHPDTLSLHFKAIMQKHKLEYQLHDLRRTFITRALGLHSALEVQLAVGHAHLTTTMSYIRDNRELEDALFVPKVG